MLEIAADNLLAGSRIWKKIAMNPMKVTASIVCFSKIWIPANQVINKMVTEPRNSELGEANSLLRLMAIA